TTSGLEASELLAPRRTPPYTLFWRIVGTADRGVTGAADWEKCSTTWPSTTTTSVQKKKKKKSNEEIELPTASHLQPCELIDSSLF
ncbi:hypothetical protein CpipJ_CPIJ000305, partial [Culex quinquefasciatus]